MALAKQVIRPTGIKTGQKSTFKHIHSPKLHPRDHVKCHDQYNKTRKRDRLTGLTNVNYTLQSISYMTIDEAPVTLLNVQLHCNVRLSPWCDCSHQKTSPAQKGSSGIKKKGNSMKSQRKLPKPGKE